MTTVRWVSNLAADLELEDPAAFAPSSRLRARIAERADQFLALANRTGAEVGIRHVHIDAKDPARTEGCGRHASAEIPPAMIAQAWSPTPAARRECPGIGRAPALAVLQRVNHRAFGFALGPGLPMARFVTSLEELESHLEATPWPHAGWLLKRPFGFSGRARKRLAAQPDAAAARGLDAAARRFAEVSMVAHGGGLLVEPFVAIEMEFGMHGWLGSEGDLLLGRTTRLVTDADGAWSHTRLVEDGELRAGEPELLLSTVERVAAALHAAGYFGPFGIDAYRYRADSGELVLQPLGELNARYCMGYFVGICGELQREWSARVARLVDAG